MAKYEAKRFNIGEEVFVVKPHDSSKFPPKGACKISCKKKWLGNTAYKLEGDEADFWYDDELEVAEFKKGDIVKLNPDARIGNFPRDADTGTVLRLHKGTTTALEGLISLRFDEEYTVIGKEGVRNTLLRLRESYDSCLSDYLFDACLFTLVRRPEKVKVKEVTIEELEKHYGCKVKIVKENEK